MNIPILILAAGASRRMRGQDKLLQLVGDTPLLRRQVLTAQATGHPVYVALPAFDHPRAAAINDLDVTLLAVPEAPEGQSATLRGAVAQLPICDAFMILLGDLVELTPTDLRAVLSAMAAEPDHLVWRGATQDGKPGHPVLFNASLRGDFAKINGDSGGAGIIKAQASATYLVPLPGQHARCDLDTPEDWDAWRAKTGQADKR